MIRTTGHPRGIRRSRMVRRNGTGRGIRTGRRAGLVWITRRSSRRSVRARCRRGRCDGSTRRRACAGSTARCARCPSRSSQARRRWRASDRWPRARGAPVRHRAPDHRRIDVEVPLRPALHVVAVDERHVTGTADRPGAVHPLYLGHVAHQPEDGQCRWWRGRLRQLLGSQPRRCVSQRVTVEPEPADKNVGL